MVKRQTKKAVRKAAKTKGGLFVILVIVVLIIAAVIALSAMGYLDLSKYIPGLGSHETETETQREVIVYDSDDLLITFMELGNWETGDSTFIKAGDTDILIDAGSNISSIPFIKQTIDQYCQDGKLEYVIVTHAHEDH